MYQANNLIEYDLLIKDCLGNCFAVLKMLWGKHFLHMTEIKHLPQKWKDYGSRTSTEELVCLVSRVVRSLVKRRQSVKQRGGMARGDNLLSQPLWRLCALTQHSVCKWVMQPASKARLSFQALLSRSTQTHTRLPPHVLELQPFWLTSFVSVQQDLQQRHYSSQVPAGPDPFSCAQSTTTRIGKTGLQTKRISHGNIL